MGLLKVDRGKRKKADQWQMRKDRRSTRASTSRKPAQAATAAPSLARATMDALE